MEDYSNSIPRVGRWLFGAPEPLGFVLFDITDEDNFPFTDKDVCRYPSYDNYCETFKVFKYSDIIRRRYPNTDDFYYNYLCNFWGMISDIRYGYKKIHPHKNFIGFNRYDPMVTQDYIRGEGLRKRKFFLEAATTVITSSDSVRKIAKRLNVNKLSLLIWVYIYLVYGPQCFFRCNAKITPKKEEEIIQYYLDTKSIIHTCAAYAIFDSNRLKRILRNNRLKSLSF